MLNPKIIQISLKSVLGSETGVHEETFFEVPFFEAPVVEQLKIILNNKGDDIVLQALLKENQVAYTDVSILARMDVLKRYI